jgi:hypothetical protein
MRAVGRAYEPPDTAEQAPDRTGGDGHGKEDDTDQRQLSVVITADSRECGSCAQSDHPGFRVDQSPEIEFSLTQFDSGGISIAASRLETFRI